MLARAARVLLLLFLGLSPAVYAAKLPKSFSGFVTEVSAPGQFRVGARVVHWSQGETQFYRGENESRVYIFPAMAVHFGAFLRIEGKFKKKTGEFAASNIELLAPYQTGDKRISDLGMIEEEPKLVSDGQGAKGLLWVDGYPLQITAKTKLLASDGKSFPVNKIHTNVWADFDAIRKPDGSMEALSIKFEPNTASADEIKFRDKSEPKVTAPDYAKRLPGEIKFHGSWALKILPDKDVQDYVAGVGERLIPEYQKKLTESDPTKIKFRFYVVERPTRWKEKLNDAEASAGGIVVVPDNVLAALDNEAQLAALLSNCIAVTLEKQSYIHRTRSKIQNDIALASALDFFLGPGALIAGSADIVNHVEANRLMLEMNELASRIGMRYMLHDGYDIREAPFAWAAAANKRATNPQPGDFYPSAFEQDIVSDLYFIYPSMDYAGLKTNRAVYQQMVKELRRDDPKLPKAKNRK